MKLLRWAILGGLLAALALGVWFLAKRPGHRPQEEPASAAFRARSEGAWTVIEYAEDQVPIRAMAWVQGRPPGLLFAQVLTQNDRQQLTVFDRGSSIATLSVPRPQEVSEGFFRFAELRDGLLVSKRKLLLVYGPGDGRKDGESLLLLLDLDGQVPMWAHRSNANRIAFESALDPDLLYAYGESSPVLKIRLPAAGKTGSPKVETIDLPAEIETVSSALPSGGGALLLAHAKGLSAYLGTKGWVHHPLPARPALSGKQAGPKLAAGGGGFWWQPFPGQLLQVGRDGGTKAEVAPGAALSGGDLDLDRGLFSLLGCDPAGDLWFGLVPPLLPDPAPLRESAALSKEPAQAAEPTSSDLAEAPPQLPAEERERWEAHLKGGLARIYRWTPGTAGLRMYIWTDRGWSQGRPAGFQPPEGHGSLHPESGGFLLGGDRRVAWAPLAALGPGQDPAQPK